MCWGMCMCVYVYVLYIYTHIYINTYTHTYIHIAYALYTHVYVYLCIAIIYMYTSPNYICTLNTYIGSMCIYIYIYVYIYTHTKNVFQILYQLTLCSVTKLCPTLCNPMECSLLGSSVHGIFQARILKWAAIWYSRGSSWPRDQTHVSCVSYIGRQILYHWATWKSTD